MEKFFIVDTNDEGWTFGIATNNLQKDFIDRFGITFDNEGRAFGEPEITNISVKRTDREVLIFDMSSEDKSKNCIAKFNFFTENYYDDLVDFISEHWRTIKRHIDESASVKKYKDFK